MLNGMLTVPVMLQCICILPIDDHDRHREPAGGSAPQPERRGRSLPCCVFISTSLAYALIAHTHSDVAPLHHTVLYAVTATLLAHTPTLRRCATPSVLRRDALCRCLCCSDTRPVTTCHHPISQSAAGAHSSCWPAHTHSAPPHPRWHKRVPGASWNIEASRNERRSQL